MKIRYGKNVLITGGTSGIGMATAVIFSEKGCNVTVCGRKKPSSLPDRIKFIQMDVTKEESVREAFSSVTDLDIVIHCAGFGIAGSGETVCDELAHAQMETNYFGVLRVNRYALPLLREKTHSLILVASSVAGRMSIPFQGHYSSSKFALEAYVEALRMETHPFGVRAALVEPGDTRTGFTSARIEGEKDSSAYSETEMRSIAGMAKSEQNGKSPDTVARVFYALACKKNPPVRKAVGLDYKLLCAIRRIVPDRFAEWVLRLMYCK